MKMLMESPSGLLHPLRSENQPLPAREGFQKAQFSADVCEFLWAEKPFLLQRNPSSDERENANISSFAKNKLEVSKKTEVQELSPVAARKPIHLSSTTEDVTHMELSAVSYPLNQEDIAPLLQEEIHLQKGRQTHDHIIKIGLDHDVFIENMIVNMYGRCGALEDAYIMFLSMPKTNPASWNAMISVYAQHGHGKDALQLYMQMQRECVMPSRVTFMSVLHACDNPTAFMEGTMIHARIVETGYETNVALGTALVSMYGKCGSIDAACIMFDKLYERNVISWTTVISVYANHGHGEDAFKVFEEMQQAGVVPNSITFLGILCALDCPSMLMMGNTIHASVAKIGLDSHALLGTALVNMYGKCGALEDARFVFDNLLDRTVVSWNAMIDAYAQNEEGEEALQLFWKMQHGGVKPDDATFVSALSACLSLEATAEGEAIHACIKKSRCEGNVMVATALVNMYGKCGDLNQARLVFDNMYFRNVVSWNTLIGGYTQHGHGKEALQLFHRMLEEGVMANKVTFISILSACEILSALVESKRFHAGVIGSGFESDVALGTAIVNVYGKCGDLKEARLLFDRMQQRNPVSWNAMISVYAQQGHAEEALELFRLMLQEELKLDEATFASVLTACASLSTPTEGELIHAFAVKLGLDATVDVGTALVNMYGKCGALEEANSLFGRLSVRNVVTWNAIIGAYAQHGYECEAIELSQKMQEEQVHPDRITFVSILSACANSSAIVEGKAFHAWIVSNGFESDLDIGTALVNMYGKCGDLNAAHSAFDKLHERRVIAWNSMLATYAQHGLGKEAFNLFLRMLHEGPRPDAVTFLSILSACSHAGLMDEGLRCFAAMRDDYNIQPKIEHFGCMIDLYGRSGKLQEAERFIFKMALQHHALVWRTLLGACKLHNNLELGRHAAEHAMDLDPENPAPYVLLSIMYAKNQRWDEVELMRRRMVERGVQKPPGCSKIYVGNKEHHFCSGDMSHPESEAIYVALDNMCLQMKTEGYEPSTTILLHDVEELQKEHLLDSHSEKLAIAYGLISTPSEMSLHIITNLRICHDCHVTMKFVSKTFGRDVTVRDSYQHHHFKSGMCTCGG